jgi:hypothetical protein
VAAQQPRIAQEVLQVMASLCLRGRLIEHLNEFHDRGIIIGVFYPDKSHETVQFVTDQGKYIFNNQVTVLEDGTRILPGDRPRFAMVVKP